MSLRHVALIVEDDEATRIDLVEMVTSLDCHCITTDNREDAVRLLAERHFCAVLLDLEIKQTVASIKGHLAQGKALLREILEVGGRSPGAVVWTPVIIVSGHANEVDEAVAMMREGVDDVIRKPLRIDDVVERIRNALKNAGRHSHERCTAVDTGSDTRHPDLRILGKIKGQRAEITISGKSAWLPASSMKVLLQLAIAHQKGTVVHKIELGAKPDEGFKAISRLRDHLKPALGEDNDIVANDHHGGYALKPEVQIAACDAHNLKQMGAQVVDLAATLSRMIEKKS